jgi:secretion/DNA translocation related TadE-like protein
VTISMLGVGVAIVVLAGLAATVSGYMVIHCRAAIAADLAALAGARYAALGDEAACARAEQVGQANGAMVVECRVEKLDLVVSAAVSAPAGIGMVRATARAGPIGQTADATDPAGSGTYP